MGQVSSHLTKASAGQVLGALLAAGVSRTAANILAAQSGVETADWSAMHNWNLGNITVAALSSWELQGNLTLHFGAYPNIVAGAKAMVAWIRQKGCLDAADLGDLPSFVQCLERGCYLGCVGQTVAGHVVSANDYENYRLGLSSRLARLQATTPIAPGGGFTTTLAIVVLAGAVAYGANAYGLLERPKRILRQFV